MSTGERERERERESITGGESYGVMKVWCRVMMVRYSEWHDVPNKYNDHCILEKQELPC